MENIFLSNIDTCFCFSCLADVMPISVNGRCYCQEDVICLVWNVADVIAKRQRVILFCCTGRCYCQWNVADVFTTTGYCNY